MISVQKLGAGEILLTSIDNDGTMQGYDLDIIKIASNIISIPIIIQGGCKDYQNMYDAIKSGAHAISAASIFHFTQQTPLEAKEYLKEKGVFVRKIV